MLEKGDMEIYYKMNCSRDLRQYKQQQAATYYEIHLVPHSSTLGGKEEVRISAIPYEVL